MSTKSKTGVALILAGAVAMVLLFGGIATPVSHLQGLKLSANWGRLLWIATPPILMLALFVLLVRVIFMQKD